MHTAFDADEAAIFNEVAEATKAVPKKLRPKAKERARYEAFPHLTGTEAKVLDVIIDAVFWKHGHTDKGAPIREICARTGRKRGAVMDAIVGRHHGSAGLIAKGFLLVKREWSKDGRIENCYAVPGLCGLPRTQSAQVCTMRRVHISKGHVRAHRLAHRRAPCGSARTCTTITLEVKPTIEQNTPLSADARSGVFEKFDSSQVKASTPAPIQRTSADYRAHVDELLRPHIPRHGEEIAAAIRPKLTSTGKARLDAGEWGNRLVLAEARDEWSAKGIHIPTEKEFCRGHSPPAGA